MKLEIARGLFLVTALSVASLAAAGWEEGGPEVNNLKGGGLLPAAATGANGRDNQAGSGPAVVYVQPVPRRSIARLILLT